MNQKTKAFLASDTFRIIMVVVGSVFSTLVLVFAILAIIEVQSNNLDGVTKYLLGVFVVLGLTRLLTFIKERTKISLFRFITLFILNIALGVLVLFAKDNPYFFALVGGLYCLTIIISRVFKIIQNHSVRSIVLNMIIIALALSLAIGLFFPNPNLQVSDPVLIICVVVAVSAFIEVISNASSQLKLRVLAKIIVKTFALEIILGLLTTMVAFSLILTMYEPGIETFWDGLWYSFAVVTTIGFGDLKAVTPIGRAVTVFLGCYGIVVVAVITSIIVNFYNETAGKKDIEGIKQIEKEEKKNKK